MKRFICAAAMLAVCSMANAFGLKGVEVGAPYDPQSIFDKWQIKSPLCDQCLEGITEMAGVAVEIHIYKNINLDEIDASFLTSGFAELRNALVSKYGRPAAAVNVPMQNGYGAQYRVSVLTWRNAAGDVMTLISTVDGEEGSLTIKSAAFAAIAKNSGI